jgi:predicted outer membrane repeat protein
VFTGNEADYGGAVDMSRNDDTTRLTNCTFYKNTAGSDGGALHAGEAYPRILNCIVWGNEAGGDGNDIYLTRSAKHTTFRHCDIYGCGGSGGQAFGLRE